MKNFPIAIIGIGCRFPGGASSPALFWDLLESGMDAVIDVPADRWDLRRFYDPDTEKPGKMCSRQGGFLKENIFEFDSLFFGISPKEAGSLDPQQRLLLEVTYEAIEDAGLQLEKLKGSSTGVFIGGFSLDNKLLRMGVLNRHMVHGQTITSSTMTMLSSRISYTFDLRGPAVSLDTSCSSSMTAIHTACRSIGSGECQLAIAGGVNIILLPDFTIVFCKGQFLSRTSRCKAFDRDADGYVRGEGGGVVILKSYEDALADKDHIYAVIKGTGVNQDGKTKGITVPNPEAQKELMRRVYRQAQIDINQVHYFEAHGTGTPLGDPIEMQALDEVLSENRNPGNKCRVGSVKTNIGHLEAAGGIAGLIKAALVLCHKKVPPNLHFNHPNPDIDFENMQTRVVTQTEDLPMDQISYAAVNSFGYGGTNGHAVLEEPPKQEEHRRSTSWKKDMLILLPISANDPRALKKLTRKYLHFIVNETPDLDDLLYSTCFRRSHHKYRLVVTAGTREQLIERLSAYVQGAQPEGVIENLANIEEPPRIVFFYTDQDQQWWARVNQLIEGTPQTAQTANPVCQEALIGYLKSFGIVPGAVIGPGSDKVETLVKDGYSIFIEIGRGPGFNPSLTRYLHSVHSDGYVIRLFEGERPGLPQVYEALARLYTLGVDIDWKRIVTGGKYIKLPTYPWQKKHYWYESKFSRQDRLGLPGSVFLNQEVISPHPSWDVELNPLFFPFINDHKVQNRVLFPTLAIVAPGLALSEREYGKNKIITLEDIQFQHPLPIDPTRVRMLRTIFYPGNRTYAAYSWFKEDDPAWLLHTTGRIIKEPIYSTAPAMDIDEIKVRCPTVILPGDLYEKFASFQFEYGPYSRTVKDARRDKNEGMVKLGVHHSLAKESHPDEYFIHPTILEGAVQGIMVFADKPVTPASIGRITCFHSPGPECWCHVRITRGMNGSITGDVKLFDESGRIAVRIDSVVCTDIANLQVQENTERSHGFCETVDEAGRQEPMFTDLSTQDHQFMELIDRQLEIMDWQLKTLEREQETPRSNRRTKI